MFSLNFVANCNVPTKTETPVEISQMYYPGVHYSHKAIIYDKWINGYWCYAQWYYGYSIYGRKYYYFYWRAY